MWLTMSGTSNTFPREFVCLLFFLSMPVDPAAYALAVDALTNAGGASVARFDSSNCDWLVADTLYDFNRMMLDIMHTDPAPNASSTEQFDALATALGEDINVGLFRIHHGQMLIPRGFFFPTRYQGNQRYAFLPGTQGGTALSRLRLCRRRRFVLLRRVVGIPHPFFVRWSRAPVDFYIAQSLNLQSHSSHSKP